MDVKGTLLGNPGNIVTGITSFRPMAESSACRKSLPKGGFFVFIWKNRAGGEKNAGAGGVVELVDTESLVPQGRLMRNICWAFC